MCFCVKLKLHCTYLFAVPRAGKGLFKDKMDNLHNAVCELPCKAAFQPLQKFVSRLHFSLKNTLGGSMSAKAFQALSEHHVQPSKVQECIQWPRLDHRQLSPLLMGAVWQWCK